MKRLGYLPIVAIAALIWNAQFRSTSALEKELGDSRGWQGERERLRQEHERLRQLIPDAAELALLQREATEARELQRRIEDQKLSEWKPTADWRDLGNANPVDAVETMLWAAAGGDTRTLGKMLAIDPFARAGAEEIFAHLPAESRRLFSDPGQWIIALLVSGIPLAGARLMQQEQSGPDDAWVWVLLGDQHATTPTVESTSVDPLAPAAESRRVGSVFIRLRRGPDGWRLVVPRIAIENLARESGHQWGQAVNR